MAKCVVRVRNLIFVQCGARGGVATSEEVTSAKCLIIVLCSARGGVADSFARVSRCEIGTKEERLVIVFDYLRE